MHFYLASASMGAIMRATVFGVHKSGLIDMHSVLRAIHTFWGFLEEVPKGDFVAMCISPTCV